MPVIIAKGLSKLPNLHMLIKQEISSLARKMAFGTLGELPDSVLNNGKSAIPPLFNSPEVLSSVSNKLKLLAENFSG